MTYSTATRLSARRDSWPPTQVRLRPSTEPDDAEIDDLDLSYIDDDPLNYFLTPAPSSQDDDVDMFEFDAGIENSKEPAPIVRSISPSHLGGGLNRLPLRPPTPPRTLGSPSPEPDLVMASTPEDDADAYFRFGSSPTGTFSLPFSLKDFANARTKKRKEKPARTASATLLSPPASPAASPRGRISRSLGAAGVRGRTRSWSGRLSPHAWREPSPDVWAIEEETEAELNSDWGGSMMSEGYSEENHTSHTKPIDIQAAKPKKKVRFVLPAQDMMD